MSIYPQLGDGGLGTTEGTADRITDIERKLGRIEAVRTYIGEGSIDGGMVERGGINAIHIAAQSITTASLVAGSVKADTIDVLSIRAGHMQANSITATNAAIADLAVERAKIADLAVDTAKIADVTITTAKIGDLQVTNAKVANLNADKLTAGFISTDRLAFTSAVGDALLARIITAGTLVATTGLSAVSANLGVVTAGRLVVGGTSDAKTAIGTGITTTAGTKSGIVGTDASNVITFWLDNVSGNLELKGTIKSGSTGLGNLDGKVYNSSGPLFTTNPGGGVAMVADAITTRELFVTELSAITANMGTLTAGRISGGSIDGNVIDAGTINASKISVGGLARSAIANGGFEDVSTGTRPAGWWIGAFYGGTDNTVFRATSASRAGAYGLKLVGLSLSNADLASNAIPVVAGEVWTLTFWARKTGVGRTAGYAGLFGSSVHSPPNGGGGGHLGWMASFSGLDAPTTWTRYSEQFTIPLGVGWATVDLLNYSGNTGGVLEIDEVEFSRTTVATDIAPGSINTGSIAANAVTAEKFSAKIAGQNLLSTATTSFEIDVAGWLSTHGYVNYVAPVRSTARSYYGTGCMFYNATGGSYFGSSTRNIPGPFRAGRPYTLSFYEFGNFNGAAIDAYIGSEADLALNTFVSWSAQGAWNRQSVTWTPTVDAPNAWVLFRSGGGGGTQFYIDAVQLEEGDVATAWKQHIAPAVIEGSTLTGATIRTAAVGPRTQLDDGGIHIFDSAGAEPVQVNSTVGLDLLAGTNPAPSADRRIRFMSGGSSAVEVYGFKDANNVGGRLDSFSDATHPAYSLLRTLDNLGNIASTIYTYWAQSNSTGTVDAQCNGWTRTIINQSGGSSFALAGSDGRHKHTIHPAAGGALGRVLALRPVEYNWNYKRGPGGRQTGLIAQEVAAVIPHAVRSLGDADEHLTLEYSALIANLIGAVHELNAKINALAPK